MEFDIIIDNLFNQNLIEFLYKVSILTTAIITLITAGYHATSTGGALWRLFISPPTRAPISQSQAQTDIFSLVLSVFSEAFASVFISTVIVVRNT